MASGQVAELTVEQELALISNTMADETSNDVVVIEPTTNGDDQEEEEVVEKIVLEASPVKRGRGRPPKAWKHKASPHVKHAKKVSPADEDSASAISGDSESEDEADVSPVKKARGRPKKDTGSPKKRGRGRPPKAGGSVYMSQKKKPAYKPIGTVKNLKVDSDYTPTGSTRGRGRPKGSTSKSKVNKVVYMDDSEEESSGRRMRERKPVSPKYSENELDQFDQLEDMLQMTLSNCLDQQRMELCTFIDMKLARVERRLESLEKSVQDLAGTSGGKSSKS